MDSKDNAAGGGAKTVSPKKKKKNPFRYWFYDILRFSCAPFMWLWMRPKVLYESAEAKKRVKGAAVIVANHLSLLDPIAISFVLWYRHGHMIAAERLYKNAFSSWFFNHINCIRVDRQNFTMDTFRAAVDVLEDGKPLTIFPEGGRNREDLTQTPIKAFKSGAVMIAIKGKAPIIPMYIAPHKHWYNRFVVVVGEKTDPAALCGGPATVHALDRVSDELRQRELKLMEIYQQWKTRSSK